jgi:hypothetical protein
MGIMMPETCWVTNINKSQLNCINARSHEIKILYILDVSDNRQFMPANSTKYIKFVIQDTVNVNRYVSE